MTTAEVSHRSSRTLAELVRESKEILLKANESGVPGIDECENETQSRELRNLHERLKVEYSDYAGMLPIVLQWIVIQRQFNSHAMRLLFVRMKRSSGQSRKDAMIDQVAYLAHMYRFLNPRLPTEMYARYHDDMYKTLVTMDDEFMKSVVSAQAEEKEADVERLERIRVDLIALARGRMGRLTRE